MSSEAKRVVVSLVIFTLLLFGWAYYSYGYKDEVQYGNLVDEVSGDGLSGLVSRRVTEWTEEILAEREMERLDALAPLPHEEKLAAIEEVEKEMAEYITPEVSAGSGAETNISSSQSFEGMSNEDMDLQYRLLQAKKFEWIFDQLEERSRRIDIINRINGYLHNRRSPMAGTGDIFFSEAAKYGIDPRLGVAIAEAESTCGKACFSSYNAWGMLQYKSGFGSWAEGIAVHFSYLNRHFGSPQSAYDCSGYCVPNYPWMNNVQGVLESI